MIYLRSICAREQGVGCARISFATSSPNPEIVCLFVYLFACLPFCFVLNRILKLLVCLPMLFSVQPRRSVYCTSGSIMYQGIPFLCLIAVCLFDCTSVFSSSKPQKLVVCIKFKFVQTYSISLLTIPVDVVFAVVWVVIVDHKLHIVHIQASKNF